MKTLLAAILALSMNNAFATTVEGKLIDGYIQTLKANNTGYPAMVQTLLQCEAYFDVVGQLGYKSMFSRHIKLMSAAYVIETGVDHEIVYTINENSRPATRHSIETLVNTDKANRDRFQSSCMGLYGELRRSELAAQ